MASNRFSFQEDDAIVDINITPFVDVVLVLLVIFMLTAHVMETRGFNVHLPKTSHAENIKIQKSIFVTIASDGNYFLNNKSVKLDYILMSVKNIQISNHIPVVIIGADRGVVYDAVVQLMDKLRGVGVSQFALQLDSAGVKK